MGNFKPTTDIPIVYMESACLNANATFVKKHQSADSLLLTSQKFIYRFFRNTQHVTFGVGVDVQKAKQYRSLQQLCSLEFLQQ